MTDELQRLKDAVVDAALPYTKDPESNLGFSGLHKACAMLELYLSRAAERRVREWLDAIAKNAQPPARWQGKCCKVALAALDGNWEQALQIIEESGVEE